MVEEIDVTPVNRLTGLNARLAIIEKLGARCSNPACLVPGGCIDIRCLQLDHINGDGYKEKTKRGRQNINYRYYSKNLEEAHLKYQVLCANCNWIKRSEKREDGSQMRRANTGRPEIKLDADRIITLLARTKSKAEIARELKVSKATLYKYLRNIRNDVKLSQVK